MAFPLYQKGDRVVMLGLPAGFEIPFGTVCEVDPDGEIFVSWDGDAADLLVGHTYDEIQHVALNTVGLR